MRIVRLANFVTSRSGGLRTALHELGRQYAAAGHEPLLVIPGRRAGEEHTAAGRVITVPGVRVPWTGGYRVIVARRRLARLLERLEPDRLEVSDRFTLRWTAGWARAMGIASVMVSHESLAGLLALAPLPAGVRRRIADRMNARSARDHDVVLCTTRWASEEFQRIAADNLARAPLGVDLDMFRPELFDAALRRRYATDHQALIVQCGRLSAEKRPGRSVEAVAELRRSGLDAVLVVAGGGPLRMRLVRQAAGLPVHFVDHVGDRRSLGSLLASADVVIAPGPIETFGLAALEALACGTPVVVDAGSALPEVVAGAGVAVADGAFAEGVLEVLSRPEAERRRRARERAERFPWSAAADGFLAAHNVPARSAAVRLAPGESDAARLAPVTW